jgi:hypothetical protein
VSGIEPAVGQALTKVAARLFGTAWQRRRQRRVRADAQALVATTVADQLFDELIADEIERLMAYLKSPDFEEIALQLVLGMRLGDVQWNKLSVDVREELRLGLQRAAGIRAELLTSAADVVFHALVVAGVDAIENVGPTVDPATSAVAGHLSAAAAANSRLLTRVSTLTEFHKFADQLRAQVVALHSEIRLPHLGMSRSAPYGQLYVQPTLRGEPESQPAPRQDELAHPCRRTVVLGDPGAGKSTMAAKLAYDVAADLFPGAEGRVPFLIVLRSFAASFQKGGTRLLRYLEKACEDPYNLKPPAHALNYLLGNGRAVVILDGLDELVEPELRRHVVQLVEGFVTRYPLVPVVVTARRIGYSDAPLNSRLFRVGVVTELSDDQVADYVRNWFALDTATPATEQGQLATSFLAESETVGELRRNTLILALLCAMYSSEHYIPRNLAQVYERCATMLFDRWDSMRGIALPVQFQGRLRGAVQYLAWQQFAIAGSDKSLSRTRIVRILTDYLMAKRFDEDEAARTAEEFVDFCTGRAWILADVGATESEPKYGFTHRTFLEYFAAEHLVRSHPTVPALWATLKPRMTAGEWEVVGQVAVQLFDRNVEDGADKILTHILAESPDDFDACARFRGFAARALGYVHPSHDVVRAVVVAALDTSLRTDIDDRFRYWLGSETFGELERRDGALHSTMYGCLPASLPVVRRTVTEVISRAISQGNEMAMFAGDQINRHLVSADRRRAEIWNEVRGDLVARYPDELGGWRDRWAWHTKRTQRTIRDGVARFGPKILYLHDAFLTGATYSYVDTTVFEPDTEPVDRDDAEALSLELVAAERPWIRDDRWWSEYASQGSPAELSSNLIARQRWNGKHNPGLTCLLLLPYMEMRADHGLIRGLSPGDVSLATQLIDGRSDPGERADALLALRRAHLSGEVRLFLRGWLFGQCSVLGPRPSPPDASQLHRNR